MMAADSSGDEILEGFLCPICMKDLRTPSQLSAHFEEFHAEDKDILRQLRTVFGRAKNKLLKREDATTQNNQGTDENKIISSRGTPGSGGIDLLLWGSQTLGCSRSHSIEFKKIRKEKIERFIAERNNILIRLDKLVKSGIYNSESTIAAAMKARKDVERRVVPWESDSGVKYCRLCQKKFNVIVRRHHCRLCGKVYCGECCDFINSSEASNILAPQNGKISAFESEAFTNDSDDKSGIRTCISCLEILQQYCQQKSESQTKPDIVTLYERLKMYIVECDALLPKFIRMAESINIGETEYSLDAAMELKAKLFKVFEYIDVISKKIQFLGTGGEKQPSQQTLRIQRLVRNFAAGYLQENMFTTPSLPTLEQYQELIRLQEEKRVRQREEEKQRKINASLIGKEMSPPPRSHLEPKKENINYTNAKSTVRMVKKSDDDSNTSEDDSGGRAGGIFTGGGLRSRLSKKVHKPFTAVSITKTNKQGWGPVQVTMSESPDPMLQQMEIIRGYIKQAKLERKFEEVALFEQNLKELELEYMRQRQGK